MCKCNIRLLRSHAQLPFRATATAAGYDVHFCPSRDDEFVTIMPGQITALLTGLAFEMNPNVAMMVLPRSGMASKRCLRPANTPGLVDADYRGELVVMMENFGSEAQLITAGERIAQLVFIHPLVMDFETADELSETERGAGGFGSTGYN